MEEERRRKTMEEAKIGFCSLNEDIVEKILRRLPALSFVSAACVSKSWSQLCNRILFRPKLASAISLNSSADIAVQEVLHKVFSEPIRPHFAIANVFGNGFDMEKTIEFLARKLGSRTPLIVTCASGIMGRDAFTNEFKEVMAGDYSSDVDGEEHMAANAGILLTVGFVPGLKVEAIPLLIPQKKLLQSSMIDNLVMDIRNYTASASACTSPVAIIMFGKVGVDLKAIMEKMDYAMSKETIIAGDEKTEFLYRSGVRSRTVCRSGIYFSDANTLALVFARDREKPDGIGEIQFHSVLSSGVSAVGPRYKAAAVKANSIDCTTWLTARQEGQQEILDGQRILNDINDELDNHIGVADLYIGVTKLRKCSIGRKKPRLMSSLAFHAVTGFCFENRGDEEYLFVDGTGIRTADYFQFYHSDPIAALSSCRNVSMKLRNWNLDWSSKKCMYPAIRDANECKKECIGGFIFSCCGRGESFFGHPNANCSPFLENFPEVPLAGIFCGGEIGRGFSISNTDEESNPNCCLHVYSTIYLLLTYTTPPLEN